MKRLAVILLLFFISGFAFSAGYRGTYWGEPMQELANKGLLFEMVQDNNYVYMREQARVLGQSTNIWYCLSKQKLVGICYTVEDTPETREQIDRLFETRKLRLVKRVKKEQTEETSKKFRETAEGIAGNTSPLASFLVEDVICYNLGGGSLTYEWLAKNEASESNVEVIKAEYDYNTDVHIWAGILYGYILVAYTETPQDF